MGLQGGDPE